MFRALLFFSLALLVACSGPDKKESASAKPKDPGYNATLDQFSYPYAVGEYLFTSQRQKLKMAYMYLPAQSNKPTVLLLHGKNFPGAYWKTTADYLHSQGYPVLIPDQIGFGKSTKPENYQYSFPQLVTNTLGLASHLGVKKMIVIGHSMGGMLATRLSLMHPERVSQLMLLNPIGLEDYLEYVEYKEPGFFYQQELEMTPDRVRDYQQKNYYDGKWQEQYNPWVNVQAGWIRGSDWPLVAWNNALTYDMIFSEPVAGELRELKVPTTLILGTRDRTAPGRAFKRPGVTYEMGQYQTLGDRVIKGIRGGRLIKLEGLGHLPHIEDFGRFQKALGQALGSKPQAR